MVTPGLLRAARLAGGLARRAGVGGGTSLPGLIVERAAPEVISQLAARLGQGVVLVSGTNGTMNFNVFAKAAGYDTYFGRSEYNNDADFDGQWGIWDEPFLQKTVEKMRSQNKPFFSTIFTLSSHNPYRVPQKYTGKFPGGNNDIIPSIGYADYALRQFFYAAQKEEWFKNTLFVISPDHTAASEDNFYKHELGQFTIPILLYQTY